MNYKLIMLGMGIVIILPACLLSWCRLLTIG